MATIRNRKTQVNLRLPISTRKRLENFVRLTGRSKTAIAAEAIDQYLDWRIPQQADLGKGLAEADAGTLVDEKKVTAYFGKHAR